jgi:hypothetical protein
MWTQTGIGPVRPRAAPEAGVLARPRGAARGGARAGIAARAPARVAAPRPRLEGSPPGALDLAGAALVLASPLLLWAFFLAAVG